MRWTSLHRIVTGLLIERKYPIHYYVQFLYLASRGYEELHYDSLKAIKTLKIPVNEYGAFPIPCNAMDWVKVGIPNGQFVQNLSERKGITRLNNFDENGEKIPYGEGITDDQWNNTIFGGNQIYYNENGNFRGRMFGMGAGDNAYTFIWLPEREEIQLHEGLGAQEIILQFITDGSDADNATMITPMARPFIERFIIYRFKDANRNYSPSERREEERKLGIEIKRFRARTQGLTKEGIYASIMKARRGSIKG